MDTLWQDVKYGFRMLLKNRGVTLIAILTLALGIGANTAIFSVVEAVLLRNLQFRDPQRLVMVWEHNFSRGRKTNVVGPANFIRWRERNQSFEKLSAFIEWQTNITGAGEPERVPTGIVTSDFFETLGAGAAIGRTFQPEEGVPGKNNVVLLSDGYWKRRFGGDRNVLGTTITLNGRQVNIIGVMPASFKGLMTVDVWTPYAVGEGWRTARGRSMSTVARLRPGVTVAQAQAEMSGIARQIETELPDFTGGWGATVVPLREQLVGDLRTAILVLAGAVGFVLLIACANIANLLLARVAARKREIAIRGALGGGPIRLVRQLLTESVMLALVGGIAGALVAVWALEGLVAIAPPVFGRFTEIRLNTQVFSFAFVLALFSGVLFGIAPALSTSRADLQESLKEGGRTGGLQSRNGLRKALVICEVALSLMLLVGAGLLLRSFSNLIGTDPGFQKENIVSMQLTLSGQQYRDEARVRQFFEQALERIAAVPGVSSAGAISWLPLGSPGSATAFQVIGRPAPKAGEEPVTDVRMVTPGLFRTMGIPLLAGRTFTADDSPQAPKRIVINQTLARQYWPGEDPIGKRVSMSWGDDIEAEIIGVVGDVHLVGLEQDVRPAMYWSNAQLSNSFMTVMVRSERDPLSLVGALKAQVAAIDPLQAVSSIRTMDDVAAESVRQPRFTTLLLGLFAGLALLLAAVGIYGVIAYSVTQRTHEIGIRMALGAERGAVLRMILQQGMLLVWIGLAIGLAGAFALTRYMETLLFHVKPTDPGTFAAVAALLVGIALAACWFPARRATRVDPIVALRYE